MTVGHMTGQDKTRERGRERGREERRGGVVRESY